MKPLAAPAMLLAAALLGPGGCSSPYDYALTTYAPVAHPPSYDPADDAEAVLPYDSSPWFGGGGATGEAGPPPGPPQDLYGRDPGRP